MTDERKLCRIRYFMKIIRLLLCIALICFILFTPGKLVSGAQDSFVDARFVRKERTVSGTIVIWHIVRHKPYSGSMTQWLKNRAAEYEKAHKGTFIEIEGMDEATFSERLEHGRTADAYSFFSGSMYRDRLARMPDLLIAYREGLFRTENAVPYCYTGYCKLIKKPDGGGNQSYYGDDLLAARTGGGKNEASEERADVLYLDLRRAGDLIRYKEGFTLAAIEPIDNFTDAVCWLGIDRETDAKKQEALLDFISYLLSSDAQQTLNALGLFAALSGVRNVPPESGLKAVFKMYATVKTADPFRWNTEYDSLASDAAAGRNGNGDARARFIKRLQELCR